MTGVNLKEVNAMLTSFASGETKNTSDDSDSAVFAAFMNLSSQNAATEFVTAKNQFSYDASLKKDQTFDLQSTSEYYSKSAAKKITQASNDGTKKTSDAVSKETLQEFSDDVKKQVFDKLEESFRVSEEDIVNAMETLGLTVLDLLDPKNLTSLIGELTGSTDTTNLLFDSSVQELFLLTEEMQTQFSEETGIDISEFLTENSDGIPSETLDLTSEAETVDLSADVSDALLQADADILSKGSIGLESEGKTQTEVFATNESEDLADLQPDSSEETDESLKESISFAGKTEENTSQSEFDSESESGLQNNHAAKNQTLTQNVVTDAQTPQTFEMQTESEMVAQPVPTYTQVDTSELMEQLVTFTRLHVNEDTSSIEMQLNPERLGKLYIHITEKAGSVTAEIQTQNEAVKQALESQIATLKTTLEGQGVKVNAVEVTVSSHEFEKNLDEQGTNAGNSENEAARQNEKSQRRNLHIGELDDMQGLMSEEEALAASIMKDNGNSVDMTA